VPHHSIVAVSDLSHIFAEIDAIVGHVRDTGSVTITQLEFTFLPPRAMVVVN
jgi:hypothetical protein